MGVSAASNAVLAKARALYGKRLSAQNYSELLACRSVTQAAAYLKEYTAYSAALEGVPVGSLHRRRLESLLNDHLSTRCASLCRYEKAVGDRFYRHFVIKSDVELLLHAVRSLNEAHPEDFARSLPPFFYRHSDVDAQKLEHISSLDELIASVAGSPYEGVLAPFATRGSGGGPDFFAMELALNKYFYSRGRQLAAQSYNGAARRELENMLAFKADAENIVSVYRLKRLTNMPQPQLRTMLLPGGAMSEKTLGRLLRAQSAQEALKELAGTPYEAFCTLGGRSVEEVAGRLIYERCKSELRFSTRPCVVMMCYVALAENEISNLTHIIEGIRYNIPPDEISRLLIGAGD